MPEVVIKTNDSPEVEAKKERSRQRWAAIKAKFAEGDIRAGSVMVAQYQAELAAEYRQQYEGVSNG